MSEQFVEILKPRHYRSRVAAVFAAVELGHGQILVYRRRLVQRIGNRFRVEPREGRRWHWFKSPLNAMLFAEL